MAAPAAALPFCSCLPAVRACPRQDQEGHVLGRPKSPPITHAAHMPAKEEKAAHGHATATSLSLKAMSQLPACRLSLSPGAQKVTHASRTCLPVSNFLQLPTVWAHNAAAHEASQESLSLTLLKEMHVTHCRQLTPLKPAHAPQNREMPPVTE